MKIRESLSTRLSDRFFHYFFSLDNLSHVAEEGFI